MFEPTGDRIAFLVSLLQYVEDDSNGITGVEIRSTERSSERNSCVDRTQHRTEPMRNRGRSVSSSEGQRLRNARPA